MDTPFPPDPQAPARAQPEEPRYTLEEAHWILRRRECDANGHDWVVFEGHRTLLGEASRPEYVYCDHCSLTFLIDPVPANEEPEG